MIKVEFSAETSAEVHQQIKDFAGSPNTVSTASTAKKKIAVASEEDEEDEEERPAAKKKPAAKTKSSDDDLDDAALRAKIKDTDWPIDQAKAFINKFGFDNIPSIPAKRRQEFVDLIDEISKLSAKKFSAYLEDDDI